MKPQFFLQQLVGCFRHIYTNSPPARRRCAACCDVATRICKGAVDVLPFEKPNNLPGRIAFRDTTQVETDPFFAGGDGMICKIETNKMQSGHFPGSSYFCCTWKSFFFPCLAPKLAQGANGNVESATAFL